MQHSRLFPWMLLVAADSISSWNVTFPAGSIGLHLAVFDERVVVQAVAPDSPAARASRHSRGDVVTRVNARRCRRPTAGRARPPRWRPRRRRAPSRSRSDAFARWFRAAQTELPPSLRDGDFAIAQGLVEVARAGGSRLRRVRRRPRVRGDRGGRFVRKAAARARRRRRLDGAARAARRLPAFARCSRSRASTSCTRACLARTTASPSPNATDVPPELVEAARVRRPPGSPAARRRAGDGCSACSRPKETPAATRARRGVARRR